MKKVVVTLLLISMMANASYASIFDDIFKLFGQAKEETVVSENTIDSSLKLDENQKKVKKVIEDIYDGIINVDLEKVFSNTDFDDAYYYIKELNALLKKYPCIKEYSSKILCYLKYEIQDMYYDGTKMKVKIKYSIPNIKKVVSAILPKLILSNFSTILSGNIDNETLNSILKTISEELASSSFERDEFAYDFTFDEIDNSWKLIDVGQIEVKLGEYFNKMSKEILK